MQSNTKINNCLQLLHCDSHCTFKNYNIKKLICILLITKFVEQMKYNNKGISIVSEIESIIKIPAK